MLWGGEELVLGFTGQPSWNTKFQVLRETMYQENKARAIEEDTQNTPLASPFSLYSLYKLLPLISIFFGKNFNYMKNYLGVKSWVHTTSYTEDYLRQDHSIYVRLFPAASWLLLAVSNWVHAPWLGTKAFCHQLQGFIFNCSPKQSTALARAIYWRSLEASTFWSFHACHQSACGVLSRALLAECPAGPPPPQCCKSCKLFPAAIIFLSKL